MSADEHAGPHTDERKPVRRPRASRTPAEWLEYYQLLAVERGGRCLSDAYLGAHDKMRFVCAWGHEFTVEPNSVRQGSWCSRCADQEKADKKKQAFAARVRQMVAARGGRCLSTAYVDSQTALRWRCSEGHEWEAVPASIARGSWCAVCAGVARLTIDDVRATAKERGGELVSTEYTNLHIPLRWRCAVRHEWNARPGNIRMGRWCPKCAGKAPYVMDDLRSFAAKFGGECLSTEVGGAMEIYLWRCRVGHEFKKNANAVQQGRWCPRCRGTGFGDLERLKNIAQRRGGDCLSANYVNLATRMWWRCGKGHEWQAEASRIVQGSWWRPCPACGGTLTTRPPLGFGRRQREGADRRRRRIRPPVATIGTIAAARPAYETFDKRGLLAPAVVQLQLSAQFLEAVARERAQDVDERHLA